MKKIINIIFYLVCVIIAIFSIAMMFIELRLLICGDFIIYDNVFNGLIRYLFRFLLAFCFFFMVKAGNRNWICVCNYYLRRSHLPHITENTENVWKRYCTFVLQPFKPKNLLRFRWNLFNSALKHKHIRWFHITLSWKIEYFILCFSELHRCIKDIYAQNKYFYYK